MPRASKQAVDALVFRRLQERKHVEEMEPVDPELTLRPDTTKTLKRTAERRYYHTGKWEKSRVDGQEECWSCCMNGEKESEGCVGYKYDKSKWILSSYT